MRKKKKEGINKLSKKVDSKGSRERERVKSEGR